MASPHRQVLTELVQQRRWTHGAELGVDKGILTAMLLRNCPTLQHLVAVDTFPDEWRSRKVFQLEQQNRHRLTVYQVTTREASTFVYNGSLDFVFIDADHSYQGAREDINLWRSKVKAGGWLGGHDYNPKKFPGVVSAVDQAFGRKVEHRAGDIWGVWV